MANDRYPLRPISSRHSAARMAVSYRRLRIDNLRFLSGRRAEIIGDSGGNYLTTGYAGLQSHRKAHSLTVSVNVEPYLGDKSVSEFNQFRVFRVKIELKQRQARLVTYAHPVVFEVLPLHEHMPQLKYHKIVQNVVILRRIFILKKSEPMTRE